MDQGQLLRKQAERDRLDALKKANKKLITRKQAAGEIGVTERQVGAMEGGRDGGEPAVACVVEMHPWRLRRSGCGELVRGETSDHDGLGGRGGQIDLLWMIDDATSRLFGRFVRHGSSEEIPNIGVVPGATWPLAGVLHG